MCSSTLSQSIPKALRSSQLEVSWKPGMTRCSRVRVCTMESINSSRVRSLATEGDRRTRRTDELPLELLWSMLLLLFKWWAWLWWAWWAPRPLLTAPFWWWPLSPRPPESSRKLSRIIDRTGARVSRYLNSSILDGDRLMLRRYGGRLLWKYTH